jgi:drug/metabolite transporter (DMT)-like permease
MLLVASSALLWAIVEGLGGLLADDYSPFEVVWMRYATHLAFLAVLFVPGRGKEIVESARPGLQIARGSLMLLMPACFVAALLLSSPENVLGVFWIVPLLTMALSAWLLAERVDRVSWLAGGIAWLGAVVIVRPDRGALGIGLVPALGMALCLSLYLVFTRQLRYESTVTNLVFTAACVLMPLTLTLPLVWRMPSSEALAVMAAIGVIGLGALFALDRALEGAPVSAVAPMLYLQPVWTVMLAALTGQLDLGLGSILGIVQVVAVCMALLVMAGWNALNPILGSPEMGGTATIPVCANDTGEARTSSVRAKS